MARRAGTYDANMAITANPMATVVYVVTSRGVSPNSMPERYRVTAVAAIRYAEIGVTGVERESALVALESLIPEHLVPSLSGRCI